MQASPERYGIRPDDPSTTEADGAVGGRCAERSPGRPCHARATQIRGKISQISATWGRRCTAAQIFLTFELRRLMSRVPTDIPT
jgi:hypothetical protein